MNILKISQKNGLKIDEFRLIRHPFLIFGLCKKAGVPLEDNEAWIHPIKAIYVKRDKPGVPHPEKVYYLGNEPLDEDEPRVYQFRFGIPVGT